MSTNLLYPHDRTNGYALLHDGAGDPYVPEFARLGHMPLGYCRAFLEFMRRMDTPNPFDGVKL